MSQRIEKTSIDSMLYYRDYRTYKRARDAFGALLDTLGIGKGDSILVPGYIGWSAREGSGVFDPIKERGITPVFYHMDDALRINQEDCREKINSSKAKLLLIIHYFGFVDPVCEEVISYAKKNGIIVLEDAAHALLSDRVGNACGTNGDYTLYSLHKMLPMKEGGMIVSNHGAVLPEEREVLDYGWEKYDLARIAKRRIQNYKRIAEKLEMVASPQITSLIPELKEGMVPQTYPVVLCDTDRDKVYSMMNDRGWGVVSLYHTMIETLHTEEFEKECWLSKHITNLPVHQDVKEELIGVMVKDFVEIVENCSLEKTERA